MPDPGNHPADRNAVSRNDQGQATTALGHPPDASHDVPDQWSQADFARRLRQKGVLNVSQQHLRDQAAKVVHLIAAQRRARWMMQVHFPQRTLEAVFKSLLLPMSLQHLVPAQRESGRHDHGIGRKQILFAILFHPAPNDDASISSRPLARLVHRLLHLDLIIVFVGYRRPDRVLVNLTDDRRLHPAIRQRHGKVPPLLSDIVDEFLLVVGIVHRNPDRDPVRNSVYARQANQSVDLPLQNASHGPASGAIT